MDLSKDKQNGSQANYIKLCHEEKIKMLEPFGYNISSYLGKRNSLKDAFLYMHLLPEKSRLRVWLEDLIKKSMEYAHCSLDETYVRRHNTFIKHYILKQNKRITEQEQFIGSVTVTYDVNEVLDKIMIFAFGLDALKDRQLGENTVDDWRYQKSSLSFVVFYADNNSIDRGLYLEKIREIDCDFTNIIKSKNYTICHKRLKKLFLNYNLLPEDDKAKVLLEDLIYLHKKFTAKSRNKGIERRHKIFYKKITSDMSAVVIAKYFSTTSTIVYRDINKVIDDIMVLAFGIKKQT